MTFTTLSFILLFLPAALILVRLAGRRGHALVLLLMSLAFAYLAGGNGVLILLAATAVTCLAGLGIESAGSRLIKKTLLIAASAAGIGLMAVFKYASFFEGVRAADALTGLTEGLLPLGLSFYIFQSLSYLFDVYHGEPALKNPLKAGVYMAFFPKLISGPLVRLKDFRRDLEGRAPSREELLTGFERFLTGLCKKVLLADQLHKMNGLYNALNHADEATVSLLWLHVIAFALSIYFDFAGYTDMAIGLARMFGFHLPENFRDPYCCRTMTDFWRRWHITLSQWFRDYVYIPLGGSRRGAARTVLNLLIVWLLTGIWHGSTLGYILWGLGHFALIALEKFTIKPDRFVSRAAKGIYRAFTLFAVSLLWVFFEAHSLKKAMGVFAGLFGFSGLAAADIRTVTFLRNEWGFLIIGVILASPLVEGVRKPRTKAGSAVLAVLWFAGVLLAVSYIMRGAYNPFVYQIF